jgi:phospholipid/cholesterol/gamma-HCH transport system ATP-binding protein
LSEIIKLQGVHKSFGSQEVLRGVDLSIPRDSVCVIVGRSGGGKSVLLKHLIGLLKPERGRVFVDGVDIVPLHERELAKVRRRFGMLFQGAALFDSLTVAENVAFPLRERSGKRADEIEAVVEAKLKAVGLSGMGGKMPAELSGGMRKRVGLARAMALDPEIVLFDEPTSGLDPIMSGAINDLIRRTNSEFRATCVVISHDIASTMAIADRVFMLNEGRIIAEGTPEEMRDSGDPAVQQFLKGETDGPIQVIG